MIWLTELYISLRDFMESGGPVLWYIAILVTFMWALIFERIYYFLFIHDEFASSINKRLVLTLFRSLATVRHVNRRDRSIRIFSPSLNES